MNTHTETQMKSRPPQQKRLEGVETTDELRQLIRDVRSFGGHSNALQHREKDEIHPLMIPSMSRAQAVEVLRNFDTTNINVPVSVLRAIETLCTGRREYMERLDQCLQATQLAFTSPPSSEYIDSEERRKFRRRMEKLKLRDEERSYGGLVKNVGLQAMTDDVTTRSMTYAASIGLNMIVAPLSFGCFMYFFASGLFNYMGWDANRPTHLGPDIRKVRRAMMIRIPAIIE